MKSRLTVAFILLACISAFAAEGDEKVARVKSKKQGWLGVSIQDVTPTFAREHDLKIKEGAFISEVIDDSPADSAGLKEGDVVVEFNGKKIEASQDLTDAVRETAPGTKVTAKFNRSGENKSVPVTVGKNRMRTPFAIATPRIPHMMVNMSGGIEGMELLELNKQLGEYFEAPSGKGVLVKNVEKEENGAKAGIKAGDVITKIGTETVTDIGDIRDAVSDAKEGDKVNVELLRKGKKMTVTLEISEEAENDNHIFWREGMPGNFNFHFEPRLEQMQKEMEMQLKELPRRQKELDRVQDRLRSKGV